MTLSVREKYLQPGNRVWKKEEEGELDLSQIADGGEEERWDEWDSPQRSMTETEQKEIEGARERASAREGDGKEKPLHSGGLDKVSKPRYEPACVIQCLFTVTDVVRIARGHQQRQDSLRTHFQNQ
eukprot:3021150-Rhodomonas_salina.1